MQAEAFEVTFRRPHPFGVVAGVALDAGKTDVPAVVLGRLAPREALIARSHRGHRLPQWVGGRLAASAAGRSFGVEEWAVLVDPDGSPRAPGGFTVSIAHKQSLAIALVSREEDTCLGVDLEDDLTAAHEIESIVLSIEERRGLDRLRGRDRDRALILAFALKEATYKAFARRFDRMLGYHEVRVSVSAGGTLVLSAAFDGVVVQPTLEAVSEWRGTQVIAAVRSQWRNPSSSAR